MTPAPRQPSPFRFVAPDPVAAKSQEPKEAKEPWWVETLMKVSNLVLVVGMGFLVKCGTDSFSQNMARGGLVKDLLATLANRKTQEDKVRQDIALLSLDRFLVGDKQRWERYLELDSSRQKNQQFVARIAAVIFNDIEQDATIKPELRQQMGNVVRQVMRKNDPHLFFVLDSTFTARNREAIISNPDITKPVPSEKQAAQSANSGLQGSESSPLVYIQIRQANEREDAEWIQRACQNKGWKAPGIQLMPKSSVFDMSIRYYYAEDEQLAGQVRTLMAQGVCRPPDCIRMVNLSERGYKAARRQIEVWINTATPCKLKAAAPCR